MECEDVQYWISWYSIRSWEDYYLDLCAFWRKINYSVLKQPESHTMIVGVGGSGRQSLSRLATHISGYEFYQFEMGKDDGFKEWRDNLKNVLKKTSLTINQNVLFLYENQMHDLRDVLS